MGSEISEILIGDMSVKTILWPNVACVETTSKLQGESGKHPIGHTKEQFYDAYLSGLVVLGAESNPFGPLFFRYFKVVPVTSSWLDCYNWRWHCRRNGQYGPVDLQTSTAIEKRPPPKFPRPNTNQCGEYLV
jgi:hypothetical protein